MPSLDYVDDDSCERAVAFVRSSAPKRGLWLFYAAAPAERGAARAALRTLQGATAKRCAGGYFVVRSRRALPPRALIALGRSLRLTGGGGAAEPARQRVAAGRPSAAALTGRLHAVWRPRRSGHLASLAAGHDVAPVVVSSEPTGMDRELI